MLGAHTELHIYIAFTLVTVVIFFFIISFLEKKSEAETKDDEMEIISPEFFKLEFTPKTEKDEISDTKAVREWERFIKGEDNPIIKYPITGRMVLIADLKEKLATALGTYTLKKTEIETIEVLKHDGDLSGFDATNVDFFVVVGYVQNSEFVENALERIRLESPDSIILYYANISSVVLKDAKAWGINYLIDRWSPIVNFFEFMELMQGYDPFTRKNLGGFWYRSELERIIRNEDNLEEWLKIKFPDWDL